MNRLTRTLAVSAAAVGLVAGSLVAPAQAADPTPAPAPTVETKPLRVSTTTNVSLAAQVKGAAPLSARPTVVEFTPYGENGASYTVGPDYNFLTVQIRGTGDSDGEFDVLGPKTQQDVFDTLKWACQQPWSNGDLAVVGFSASAITLFNSLHRELPCVKAAIMRSGTFELYRDLLVPGGIPNSVPGLVVLLGIGGLALAQGAQRLGRNPASTLDAVRGILTSGLEAGLLNPTLNTFWKERGFRGDATRVPTLLIDGTFDVEPRGDYQAFQQLQDQGTPARLLVVGAHDGAPRGTDFGQGQIDAWLDHYVRGVDNGTEQEPAVQMLLANGSRQDQLLGKFIRYTGDAWPIPGTTWTPLSLSAKKSGTNASPTDGSLALTPDTATSRQSYASVTSVPTQTDPTTIAATGGGPDGEVNKLLRALPFVETINVTNQTGITFTSPALTAPVTAVGPATLDVRLSSLLPNTPIWAVLSDVWPDGSSHPMTTGRLNTGFPDIVKSKSLYSDGQLVQPYGDYSTMKPALPLQARDYHVELWPIGNRFEKGHRIQLTLVGQSPLSLPSLPSINTVTLGGSSGTRLMFPTVPGSDLEAALR